MEITGVTKVREDQKDEVVVIQKVIMGYYAEYELNSKQRDKGTKLVPTKGL